MPREDMTPLKRATRAVLDEFSRQNAGELTGVGGDIEDAEAMARAVLQAIREPSEGMVNAGDSCPGLMSSEWMWPAMIDAALEEGA